MALIDGDRFEGKVRDGVHTVDVSDLMRRMVKENLLKFDGKPLFPERHCENRSVQLSPMLRRSSIGMYRIRDREFNRAEELDNNKRRARVGFALTILQRRFASSPEAIYQSLVVASEKLESGSCDEIELSNAAAKSFVDINADVPELDEEDMTDIKDSPAMKLTEESKKPIVDQATAARTITELQSGDRTLRRTRITRARPSAKAGRIENGTEVSSLLSGLFADKVPAHIVAEELAPYLDNTKRAPVSSPHQKLVIFTEHRDTLQYLVEKTTTLLGRSSAVVSIHGGMGREERQKARKRSRMTHSCRC